MSAGGSSGWVKLLSTATLTGIVAVAGIILSMFCKKRVRRQLGEILLGFAILVVLTNKVVLILFGTYF